MDDWAISRSQGTCSETGVEFQPGQDYFAALVETEDGLLRKDYCADFWEKEKPHVYYFWKTRLPDENEKKQIFIDDEMLMAFFERLGKDTDPEKINFRFVITLILMRKRKLKYDSEKTDGDKEIWRLKVPGQGEYVDVINPHLNEEQIGQLSNQLGQILHAEL